MILVADYDPQWPRRFGGLRREARWPCVTTWPSATSAARSYWRMSEIARSGTTKDASHLGQTMAP